MASTTTNQAECLSEAMLERLATGQCTPAELAGCEEHVGTCVECRELMETRSLDACWQQQLLPAFRNKEVELANKHESPETTFRMALQQLGPTDDPRMIGRIGSYEVVGVIGCGAMGVVFKAFDPALNRYVAIKMMQPHLAVSGAARQRFAREGRAAAAVINDCVLPIHAVAEWQGVPYLVMQYSAGMNLQKRLEEEGPLKLNEILRIGMQTAQGLAAAHSQGLVHRDVKPSNILLEGSVERALLTDFGLARAVDDASVTCTGLIAGTPQYMSPEQVRGEAVDARSDLFSLGATMYAMCTGRSPFRGESTYSVLHRLTHNEPRSIQEINPEIPAWVCGVISKLLSKDPDKRLQSADEVAELLEDCLAHVQNPTTTLLPAPVAKLAKSRGPDNMPSNPTKTLDDFHYPPTRKLIAVAAFAIALLLAGIFITLETSKGTITIESDTDDVPVVIRHGDQVYDQLTVNRDGKSIRVRAGEYEIDIDGSVAQFTITNRKIAIQRRGESVVQIRQASRPASENHTKTVSYSVSDLIDNESSQTVEQQLKVIVDLLHETVAPDSWRSGEHHAEPYPQNTSIVVRQTARIHEQIESMLASLKVMAKRKAFEQILESIVTFEYSAQWDNGSASGSGIGWIVDEKGHIVTPALPTVVDEKLEIRLSNGERYRAQTVQALGRLTLVKCADAQGIRPIQLKTSPAIKNGDSVLGILNGIDFAKGTVTDDSKTIAISGGSGYGDHPAVRYPNLIVTDFELDAATLVGAPLLTQSGDVAGMLLHFADHGMCAMPIEEIRVACQQFGVLDATSDPNQIAETIDNSSPPLGKWKVQFMSNGDSVLIANGRMSDADGGFEKVYEFIPREELLSGPWFLEISESQMTLRHGPSDYPLISFETTLSTNGEFEVHNHPDFLDTGLQGRVDITKSRLKLVMVEKSPDSHSPVKFARGDESIYIECLRSVETSTAGIREVLNGSPSHVPSDDGMRTYEAYHASVRELMGQVATSDSQNQAQYRTWLPRLLDALEKTDAPADKYSIALSALGLANSLKKYDISERLAQQLIALSKTPKAADRWRKELDEIRENQQTAKEEMFEWSDFLELLPETGTVLVVLNNDSDISKQMGPVAKTVAENSSIELIEQPQHKWRRIIAPPGTHFVLLKDRQLVGTRTGLLTEKRLAEFVSLAENWLTPRSTGVDPQSLVRIDCYINPGSNNIGSQHGVGIPLTTAVVAVHEDQALLLGPESIVEYMEQGYACVAMVRDEAGNPKQLPLDVVQVGPLKLIGQDDREAVPAATATVTLGDGETRQMPIKITGYPESVTRKLDAYDTGSAIYHIRGAHGLSTVKLAAIDDLPEIKESVLSGGFSREFLRPPLIRFAPRIDWQSQTVDKVGSSIYGGNLNGPELIDVLCPTRFAPCGFTFNRQGQLIGRYALGHPSEDDMTHTIFQPNTTHSLLRAALLKIEDSQLKSELERTLEVR